jgi:hypothetical protein
MVNSIFRHEGAKGGFSARGPGFWPEYNEGQNGPREKTLCGRVANKLFAMKLRKITLDVKTKQTSIESTVATKTAGDLDAEVNSR